MVQLIGNLGPVNCETERCAQRLQVADVAQGGVPGPGTYVPAVDGGEVVKVGFGSTVAGALVGNDEIQLAATDADRVPVTEHHGVAVPEHVADPGVPVDEPLSKGRAEAVVRAQQFSRPISQEPILDIAQNYRSVGLQFLAERVERPVCRQRVRRQMEGMEVVQQPGQLAGQWQPSTGLVVVPPEGDNLAVNLNQLFNVEGRCSRKALGAEPPGDVNAGSCLLGPPCGGDARHSAGVRQVVDSVDVVTQENRVSRVQTDLVAGGGQDLELVIGHVAVSAGVSARNPSIWPLSRAASGAWRRGSIPSWVWVRRSGRWRPAMRRSGGSASTSRSASRAAARSC